MSKNILSTIVARDTATLLALATLADAATRTVRKVGDTLRFKTELPTVAAEPTPEVHDAIWTLVGKGWQVRLFEGDRIHTPSVAADGARSWNTRVSRLDRTASGAVVEVRL